MTKQHNFVGIIYSVVNIIYKQDKSMRSTFASNDGSVPYKKQIQSDSDQVYSNEEGEGLMTNARFYNPMQSPSESKMKTIIMVLIIGVLLIFATIGLVLLFRLILYPESIFMQQRDGGSRPITSDVYLQTKSVFDQTAKQELQNKQKTEENHQISSQESTDHFSKELELLQKQGSSTKISQKLKVPENTAVIQPQEDNNKDASPKKDKNSQEKHKQQPIIKKQKLQPQQIQPKAPSLSKLFEYPKKEQTKSVKYKRYLPSFEAYYQRVQVETLLLVGSGQDKHMVNLNQMKAVELIENQEKYEWVHIINPKNIIDVIEEYGEKVQKGLTLAWAGEGAKDQCRSQWIDKQKELIEEFGVSNFHYDKITSMNLRYPTRQLVVIFRRQPLQTAKDSRADFMALHAALTMEEDLPYLREWVGYHVEQGIDYIVLQDQGSLDTNKDGIPSPCFPLTQQNFAERFNQIWEDYATYIIYTVAEGRQQNTLLNQKRSIANYTLYFEDLSVATVFSQTSKFLISERGNNIDDYVAEQIGKDYTKLEVQQRKFASRYCYEHTRVTDIHEALKITSTGFSPTIIVANAALSGSADSINSIKTSYGKKISLFSQELRVNSYDGWASTIQIAIQRGYSESLKYERELSMRPYQQKIEEICNSNKCSEKYLMACLSETEKCPDKFVMDKPQDSKQNEQKKEQVKTEKTKATENLLTVFKSQKTPKKQEEQFQQIFITSKSSHYLQIDGDQSFSELPICILVTNSVLPQTIDIRTSIEAQQYKNKKVVYILPRKRNKLKQENIFIALNFGYQALKEAADRFCQPNALVMIASNSLAPKALKNLNQVFQSTKVYMVYSASEVLVEVHAFYRRVLQLVDINDFEGENEEILTSEVANNAIGRAVLELCQEKAKLLPVQDLFQNIMRPSVISLQMEACENGHKWVPYQPLFNLGQNYEIDTKEMVENNKRLKQSLADFLISPAQPSNNITPDKIVKALEYSDLLYLSEEHALAERQRRDYSKLYNIDQSADSELPLCVTVLAYENTKYDNYERSLVSILGQDYSQFHIVFVDDGSTDNTLSFAKELFKEHQQFQEKVTFVKNVGRKYDSYNIAHAAHSYCKEGEVQVVLNGWDYLVGRQVFKLISSVYQRKQPIWVAYTNSVFSDGFAVGPSRSAPQAASDISEISFLGAISTWRVEVIRSVPASSLKDKNGEWLQSSFPISLQLPLYHLAGKEHHAYIPEISCIIEQISGEVGKDQAQQELLKREPLKQLEALQGAKVDENIKKIFDKDQKERKFTIE